MQKLLFPTNLSSDSSRAYLYAVHLASRFGAALHVLHVETESLYRPVRRAATAPMDEGEVRARLHVDQEAYAAAAGGRDPDIPFVYARVHEVVTAEGILAYSLQENPDLIVMGTHGRRGLRHLLYGSIAESVVRAASCPVVTVHRADTPAPVSIEKILVPSDFSQHADAAVSYAKKLAYRFDASLLLLFVAEEHLVPVLNDTGLPSVTFMRTDPEIVAQAEAALKQLDASAEGPTVPVSYHVLRGNPTHEVLELAREEDVDLIVMNRHGHTTAETHWPGGVTEKVVRGAHCAVLTLPSKAMQAEARLETSLTGETSGSRYTSRFHHGTL